MLIEYEGILAYLFAALGFSLLIFSFRVTSGKSWLIALVSSGILNIITKKSTNEKWNIIATVQEETVGKEFAFFDEGRLGAMKILQSLTNTFRISSASSSLVACQLMPLCQPRILLVKRKVFFFFDLMESAPALSIPLGARISLLPRPNFFATFIGFTEKGRLNMLFK